MYNKYIDQWVRIKDPDICPHTYSDLLFPKNQNIVGKRYIFNKWCWINWTATWRRMKLDPSLHQASRNKYLFELNQSYHTKSMYIPGTTGCLIKRLLSVLYPNPPNTSYCHCLWLLTRTWSWDTVIEDTMHFSDLTQKKSFLYRRGSFTHAG